MNASYGTLSYSLSSLLCTPRICSNCMLTLFRDALSHGYAQAPQQSFCCDADRRAVDTSRPLPKSGRFQPFLAISKSLVVLSMWSNSKLTTPPQTTHFPPSFSLVTPCVVPPQHILTHISAILVWIFICHLWAGRDSNPHAPD